MKKLDIANLIIQPYGSERWAVGWKPEHNDFFSLFTNLGATDSVTKYEFEGEITYSHDAADEPNFSGVYNYITLTKEKIVKVFRDFALMHSIRNGNRRSVKNATARAESQFNQIRKVNFIGREYDLDGVVDGRRVLSGDFGGCDNEDFRESYIEKCVLG